MDRARALRDAFASTMKDPGFIEETDRMKLPINSASGEEVADVFASLYATPRPLIERAVANMTTE